MDADTMDVFHSLFDVIEQILRLIGMNVFKKNYKPGLYTILFEFSVWMAMVSTAYTFYEYDMEVKLNASTSIGVIVQGLTKLRTMLGFKKEIQETNNFLRKVYMFNRGTPMASILCKWGSRILLLLKLFAVIFVFTFIAYSLSPVAWFLNKGEWIPMLSLYIPHVDVATVYGYCFYAVLHLIWNAQTALGFYASDCLTLCSAIHVWPLVDIFEDQLLQMDRVLVAEPKVKASAGLHRAIDNLIKMHCDICWYNQKLMDINKVMIFMDVNTNAMCMMLIIFCLMVQVWYPAYFLFMMMMFKLFTMCATGTVVELATDKILAVLTQSHWYLLPIELQMKFKLMILCAQKPIIMKTGTSPLNLNTFVGYMKDVYSVSMILVEMVH